MKFELSFNSEVYKKQINFLFEREWESYLKDMNKVLLYGLIFLIISCFLIYFEEYIGFIFFIFSLYYIFDYIKSRKIYIESRNTNKNTLKHNINKYNKSDENSIWIFKDDYFLNSFDGFEGKYIWSKFDYFEIVNDMCIVYFNYSIRSVGFLISKEELGEENFNSIVDFISNKLKKA